MDKRFLTALLLTAVVIVVTPFIFPAPQRTAPAGSAATDSLRGAARPAAGPGAAATPGSRAQAGAGTARAGSAGAVPPAPGAAAPAAPRPVVAETTTVSAGGSTWRFVSPGASPASVTLSDYRSLHPEQRGGAVELVRANDRLLRFRLALGADTVPLETLPLTVTQSRAATGATTVQYTGTTPRGQGVTVTWQLPADSGAHLAHVQVGVSGAPAGSALLLELPRQLRTQEADTVQDLTHLAYSYKRGNEDVEGVNFTKLDSLAVRIDSGPFRWVAVRNKYFIAAVMGEGESQPIAVLRMQGGRRVEKRVPVEAFGVAVMPLVGGATRFQLYAGPQKYERLNALGNDLANANPYGGWLHAIVQPFATIVMRALLWMKNTTQLSYGWVLVLFGILIRVAIWPLNQSAMRSSIKMQRLQPELQAVQAKYKNDPEKQREALMKLYQSHGMSPFSPMLGCLPMLLPMPVLFALYFVFQNTIEFRGVPFLWMPDLALHDPYYITPLFMGVSMLVLSLIGMKGTPSNPQTKMMAYMMPGMMTVLFWRFPAGLNLYYAVQNLVALPQQWLLTRERTAAQRK
ncbi:MAG: membrane protein insertase YidC [Gemmatimonadaceae bacterium]